MLEPVAVLETFFGVVAGRIAVIGPDEGLHILVSHSSSWVITIEPKLPPQLTSEHLYPTSSERCL